jgi:ubiquinone/menaquinone biosynthesis C-methylase UbiE
MGSAYSDFNEANVANACYERPATTALLGDVDGKDVLEVGCGAGALTEWLVLHGASVVAFDVSPVMAALARARVGEHARIEVRDLHEGLPHVADESQDVVVASLVLHYLEDWDGILTEWRRVLRGNGVAVFSTHHPAWDWQNHSPDDYFAKLHVTEIWERAGGLFEVSFWRRPLRDMTRAVYRSGFVIEMLDEPSPSATGAELDPDAYREVLTRPFFLFFRLRPRPAAWD